MTELGWRWAAIEVMSENRFVSASDVWSFGVTMWEVLTMAALPFAGAGAVIFVRHSKKFPEAFLADKSKLEVALKKGQRLQQPDGCPNDVYQIMRSCWELSAKKRPVQMNVTIDCNGSFLIAL